MDIERLHKIIEKLTECAEHEVNKGTESLDTEEFCKVVEAIKCVAEAMYYRKVFKSMEEEEKQEKENYDEESDIMRYYRGQPRSKSSGRFMSRNDGRRSNRGRRNYDMAMNPAEITRMMYYGDEDEYMDNMMYDRAAGRMYYGGSGGNNSGSLSTSNGGNSGSNGGRGNASSSGSSNSGSGGNRYYGQESNMMRDEREGRSGQSRKRYYDAKQTHTSNSTEDKQVKVKELENYMKELSTDITEMIEDASPEEKTMLKTKMQNLITKI